VIATEPGQIPTENRRQLKKLKVTSNSKDISGNARFTGESMLVKYRVAQLK